MSYPTVGPARLDTVRRGLIGADRMLATPFGTKPFLYADYTASGRALQQVEAQVERLMQDYANPHTEDSATGRASNRWMRAAERVIRQAVNAAPGDCLLPCAAGATGAIHKLQEILGLAVAPASRAGLGLDAGAKVKTVVFVGPYEHHSNELSWRDSLAEVVSIGLDASGGIDLAALATALADPRFDGWRKIGAFSAASNVTGIRTDIASLAHRLHAAGAILCLDCAASAPYQRIDMHPELDPEAAIDAVYFSPHKFVGGPGSCGILVFDERLYRRDLPPTQSAGGTVRYVWQDGHDFLEGIEARERAGTPGLPQLVRAALAMQIQTEIGADVIAEREHNALERAFSRWCGHERIDVLGPQVPARRLGIVAFNLRKADGDMIEPRLVTLLLNDLFGIQSRAGCSCAGPYGHHLLGIDDATTQDIRTRVLAGDVGARPGWCRVSLHWIMSQDEIDYLVDAVCFLADNAEFFAGFYDRDPETGAWHWAGDPVDEGSDWPSGLLDARRNGQDAEPEPHPTDPRDRLEEPFRVARDMVRVFSETGLDPRDVQLVDV
ncbi:aminotransferase class V-fold PLP-dependent enzyme [Maricaulis sp.]|uniref:aminotransferase class V-fold PLP-dependent enzyme n=1 Tax=Maricaulis sp. TaxID=1486257 RepID=UPI0025C2E9D4|nr:aminotransferase class V-fold PLP-dependent enzyme [Maricaulis sp.]